MVRGDTIFVVAGEKERSKGPIAGGVVTSDC
jgi:hypothetical protein